MRFSQACTALLLALLIFAGCKPKSNPQDEDDGPNPVEEVAVSRSHKFMAISDMHFAAQDTGDIQHCSDTGPRLWKNALTKMGEVITSEKPDFIVLTGDLPGHTSCDTSSSPPINKSHSDDVSRVMKDLDSLVNHHKVPLFYLPGNNDALGGDYHSFAYSNDSTPYSLDEKGKWPLVYRGSAAELIDSVPEFGYYSAYPLGKQSSGPSLRIIALNTVIFSKSCKTKTHSYSCCYVADDGISQDSAATRQLNWLRDQLADAATAKDSVLLLMHIPPGRDGYSGGHMWTQEKLYHYANSTPPTTADLRFLEIVNKHNDQILGMITAHTHMDEVRLIYDQTGTKVTEVAFSVPGITPPHGNNPAFRIVEYDSSSFSMTDFTTYWTEPDAASWGGDTYNFRTDYSCRKPTIFGCLCDLNQNDRAGLEASMKKDYTARNTDFCSGAPKWGNVMKAIDVKD